MVVLIHKDHPVHVKIGDFVEVFSGSYQSGVFPWRTILRVNPACHWYGAPIGSQLIECGNEEAEGWFKHSSVWQRPFRPQDYGGFDPK